MKRIFITGAAQGIGREVAKRFWENGHELVLIDLPSLKESELQDQFPERMEYIQADITSLELRPLIEDEMKKGIDVLVNNAGVTRDSTLLKMEEKDWDLVVDVNLKSVFILSQMAAKVMKEAGGGVILNAASVVAHNGNFGQANYVATKAGVIGMTKTMAKELGKNKIRVNAIAPGFIATPMVSKMPEKVIAMMEGKTPLGRMGKPEDIANAYYFLASDEASFITGTCLNVDGGIVI
ncbi:MAG: 3-oxoacyl-ACP reductase [Halobacteriovorax sp.]|nr:3-oxoacyl-ACP reductase [Halobacteriovorax sp.]|tara:strand:+ start:167652 stop:168362 length:711 start_codon:yes stop_codon:yes gene_type:complete